MDIHVSFVDERLPPAYLARLKWGRLEFSSLDWMRH